MNYEKLVRQRHELANAPQLWQFNLLTHQELCQFAEDRGIPGFNAGNIIDLWRLGLLRTDLVISRKKIEAPLLELVSEENGLFIYCDKRQVEYRVQGYG